MVGRTIGGVQTKWEFDFPFQFKEPDRNETAKVFCGAYVCRANYDGDGGGKLGTMLRVKLTETAQSAAQHTAIAKAVPVLPDP